MAIWRKPLQFINVMLANRSPMSVAERGPGRMTYAKKKHQKIKQSSPRFESGKDGTGGSCLVQ